MSNTSNEPTISNDQRTKCEIWTRVMGYHRPVASFNKGKKGEYTERLNFRESSARDSEFMK